MLDSDHVADNEHQPSSHPSDMLRNEPKTPSITESSCSELDATPSTSIDLKSDIGYFIDETKSVSEVQRVVCSMSDSQKYHLLKYHDKPSEKYPFPKQYLGGANRSFKMRWIEECGWWLVYSCKIDGAFCICCALFTHDKKRRNMGVMVNSPFRKWHHKSEVITAHTTKQSHIAAYQAAEEFIRSIENPDKTISVILDKKRVENIAENRHVLKCVAEAILYCGRQCIALRGDKEQREGVGNPGNFLSLMKLIGNHDLKLKQHLDMPKLRNATYLSPEIQNEMIDVIGNKIIQHSIVQEVRDAQIYTIMVDEVTSHNTEMMPVCIRFVDKNLNIREELLEVVSLPRITGLHIANKLKKVLSKLGLNICDCRGQGYDGASNMSSDRVGVQGLIRHEAPKAVYMHCSGHCLNLVIASSCALPVVRNTLDKMKSTVYYFNSSPKRESLLIEVAEKEGHPASKRKVLLDVCRTRWAARHDSYHHFYTAYVFIVKALEVIALGLHKDKYSDNVTTGWEGKYRTEASGLLAGVEQFEFIITFLTVYQYLSHLEGITLKLQSTSLDIIHAFHLVEEVKCVYKSLRKTIDSDFTKIYDQAVRIANKVEVQPTRPRSAGRMQNRANAPSESVQEYFLRNMAIPFIDHIIMELEARFTPLSTTSSTLLGLVPSVLVDEELDMSEAIEMYKDDLPTPELFQQELRRWKLKWEGKSVQAQPSSCAQAIKECDSQLFPNIFQLLKLACTLPVTSCECERSASTLRRLNTFMRASMGEERLSSLAMIHTHYDMEIDLEKVVDIFANLHPRRLELKTLL